MKTKTYLFVYLLLTSLFLTPAFADHTAWDNKHLNTPSLYGMNGGFRLNSAQIPRTETLGFQTGIHGEYFMNNDFFAAGADTARMQGKFTGNLILCPYNEFFFSWSAFTNTAATQATNLGQFGIITVGSKLGYDIYPTFSVGLAFQAEYLPEVGAINSSENAWNFLPMLLATVDLSRGESRIPLRFHLNAGYRFDNSADLIGLSPLTQEQSFLLRVYPDDQVVYGAGVEIPADFMTLLAEFSGEQMFATGASEFSQNPKRVTVGFRFFPTSSREISVDGAIDVGVLNDDAALMAFAEPEYNFIFGFTFNHLTQKVAPPTPATGNFSGKVIDDKSGQPLTGVILALPDLNNLRIQSDPQTGTFDLPNVPAGIIKVRVEKEGFNPYENNFTIPGGTGSNSEIRLIGNPREKAILQVKLLNADRKPITGSVSFKELVGTKPVEVPLTGVRVKVLPGTYTVIASGKGFITEETSIMVDAEGKVPLQVEITLREENSGVALEKGKLTIKEQIHFAPGKRDIKMESFNLLNRVADLLADNKQVTKLRIEGHTDTVGKESFNIMLSQKRAEAVMDYLISRGIDRTRLEAAGFGPSKPIADNNTPQGRSLNRRVEFIVVEGN